MTSLPFRMMLSMLSPAGSRGRLSVLLFHKIPRQVDSLVPDEMCLDEFERIVDVLAEDTRVLPLDEAVLAAGKGNLPARAVALTFDDGYADWVDTVAPALKERGLPATFYIATEQLDAHHLWHERIVAAVRALPNVGSSLPYGFGKYVALDNEQRRIDLIADLQSRFKYTPLDERLAAIELLEQQAVSPLLLPPRFTEDSIRKLHSQGFSIGGHTIRHPILNECSESAALEEIGGCREILEALIRGKVSSFAYPNGRPGRDYAAKHVQMVKRCGYSSAVATSGGAASKSSDPFQLPRFVPWGLNSRRITRQLARNILEPEKRCPEEASDSTAPSVRCLLIASVFTPIHGGSAVVYESLCKHMPKGSVRVLAPKNNYQTHQPIEGWEKHDQEAEFPIDRLDYLRPLMLPPPANQLVSLYRLIFQDTVLYLNLLFAASRIVKQHDINVVCVGELVTGSWLGLALRKLYGCKLIIYVHGEEVTTATAGRLHGNLRRYYLNAADKVVAVSSFTCDALTRDMGLYPDTIALIQNGVDTERFSPGIPDGVIRERHLLGDKKILLTVGRLVPRKGIDMAIRAMKHVIRDYPNVHYLIVGDGEYRDELAEIIRQEQMGNHVTMVGKVSDEDLLRYFRACDIFLMPNRTMPDGDTEGFGLVFREANACGKPVIGGRAGGAVEAVIDGETGLLVDGNNVSDISTALLKLLVNPGLIQHLGGLGFKLAQANNTKAVSERFLKVCERLLSTGRVA